VKASDSWKARAHKAIAEMYEQWADVNHTLPSPFLPEGEKQRLWLMIKKAYPFGQRENWPYKVWCAELRKVKAFLWPPAVNLAVGLFDEGLSDGKRRVLANTPNAPVKSQFKDIL